VVREVLMLIYVSALFATVLTPIVQSTGMLRIGRWRPFKGYAVLFLLLAIAGALTALRFSRAATGNSGSACVRRDLPNRCLHFSIG